jgi:hypothetical protein
MNIAGLMQGMDALPPPQAADGDKIYGCILSPDNLGHDSQETFPARLTGT